MKHSRAISDVEQPVESNSKQKLARLPSVILAVDPDGTSFPTGRSSEPRVGFVADDQRAPDAPSSHLQIVHSSSSQRLASGEHSGPESRPNMTSHTTNDVRGIPSARSRLSPPAALSAAYSPAAARSSDLEGYCLRSRSLPDPPVLSPVARGCHTRDRIPFRPGYTHVGLGYTHVGLAYHIPSRLLNSSISPANNLVLHMLHSAVHCTLCATRCACVTLQVACCTVRVPRCALHGARCALHGAWSQVRSTSTDSSSLSSPPSSPASSKTPQVTPQAARFTLHVLCCMLHLARGIYTNCVARCI